MLASLLLTASAAPQLAPQAELVGRGELKAKVLARAKGVPAATPVAKHYTLTRGSETKQIKSYSGLELWRLRAEVGAWKDTKGNIMRIASVKSLPPPETGDLLDTEREKLETALDEAEKEFKGGEDEIAAWEKAWKASGDADAIGKFRKMKSGARYYVELEFAEVVKPQDAEKLLKAAAAGISEMTGGVSKNNTSMKWWEEDNEQYKFMTNLDRAKGGKFVKDAMSLMVAMRKAYEFYVPPQKSIGKCTVRVFKTLADYKEYLAGTTSGELDFSCGLWDPSREELLIAADDVKAAQKTMRHEAFHQYLYYATGYGHHAIWFNEGHACFFENVKYNPAKKTVDILDTGNRAMWTGKDPEGIAMEMQKIIGYTREEFYSGDINSHYVASWALVYFLEKGAYTAEEFAPWRQVVPEYLKAIAQGADAKSATGQAFATVTGRDLAADFLEFWKKHRKLSTKVRRQ